MNPEASIEQLLRWRFARAEADAPPAPRAAALLKIARPWWERWPERFQAQVERLQRAQFAYGHAMVEHGQFRTGYPVAALVVIGDDEIEVPARMLYLSVRDGRLRLRFRLDPIPRAAEDAFEVTFISDTAPAPMFAANATLSMDSEYRLDVELPLEIARTLEVLKVTDRMPFRFILRPSADGG
jgi:hypothetical protein